MSPEDRIHGWVENVLDRNRDRLQQDLMALVSNLTEAMADELAARQSEAAAAARREAEAAATALASEAIAAERRASEERLAQAAQDSTRLLAATRALDSASTLSEVLDELARQAAQFASRAAVLVHRDGRLQGWAWHGFPEAGDPREYSAAVEDAGISGTAVATGAQATGTTPDARGVLRASRRDATPIAVPLKAGGDVVGVLYADNEGESAARPGPGRPEIIETLARHAERCLEGVLVRSLPELLRAGAVERARRRTLRHDDEAAERYARLLVAEIKLYHEALVDEARRERDLLRRLRPQIERAQQLYEERVAPAVRARTSYFEQELVRTLADGDPSLLGQPT